LATADLYESLLSTVWEITLLLILLILLIANGALSSQMIYIINTNLCWGSIIC
jgi:hypothetical protein